MFYLSLTMCLCVPIKAQYFSVTCTVFSFLSSVFTSVSCVLPYLIVTNKHLGYIRVYKILTISVTWQAPVSVLSMLRWFMSMTLFDSKMFPFFKCSCSGIMCLIQILQNIDGFIKIISFSVDLTLFPSIFSNKILFPSLFSLSTILSASDILLPPPSPTSLNLISICVVSVYSGHSICSETRALIYLREASAHGFDRDGLLYPTLSSSLPKSPRIQLSVHFASLTVCCTSICITFWKTENTCQWERGEFILHPGEK